MSLDVYLYHANDCRGELYWSNITHNLTRMAANADLYKPLWRPDEIGIIRAVELIPLLEEGLGKLTDMPNDVIEETTPSNGWGNHANLVKFTQEYLKACKEFPDAYVDVSR